MVRSHKDLEIPSLSERSKNILSSINKVYPSGMMLMSSKDIKKIPVISTGCLSIDRALGIGGIPYGRIVEIAGKESGGKTTLCLHIIAEAQRKGGLCAFIDAEHALDPTYAQALDVDVEKLLISQPDHGEQALQIADMLCNDLKAGDLIVIDSVAALVPKAELEGSMEDNQIGLQARLMSKAMRKLSGKLSQAGVACVFINQMREKTGVYYGSNEVTSGGKALKFYASIRMDIRRIGSIKKEDRVVANKTRLKVKKNKLAPPFKEAEFEIVFGKGINKWADILDNAVMLGIIERSGAWYSFESEKIGQGRDNACKFLRENESMLKKVVDKLKKIGY